MAGRCIQSQGQLSRERAAVGTSWLAPEGVLADDGRLGRTP